MNLQSLVGQIVAPAPIKVSAKAKAPVKATAKPAKAVKPVKPAKPTKPAKVALVPFTVFYSEKRAKFMAVNGKGRTEAARKTQEAALAFLKTKYDVTGTVV
jgi:hypothetical protein